MESRVRQEDTLRMAVAGDCRIPVGLERNARCGNSGDDENVADDSDGQSNPNCPSDPVEGEDGQKERQDGQLDSELCEGVE